MGDEDIDITSIRSTSNTFKKFALTSKDFQGAETQFISTN